MVKSVIKTTKYCNILKQARIVDEEYKYCIEKIYVKDKKRMEIRFSLYKDTMARENRYIPRSLDVTEGELLNLLTVSIEEKVFSSEFIGKLKDILG